jgi:hypothetical protein
MPNQSQVPCNIIVGHTDFVSVVSLEFKDTKSLYHIFPCGGTPRSLRALLLIVSAGPEILGAQGKTKK